jgi:hypothetical protein
MQEVGQRRSRGVPRAQMCLTQAEMLSSRSSRRERRPASVARGADTRQSARARCWRCLSSLGTRLDGCVAGDVGAVRHRERERFGRHVDLAVSDAELDGVDGCE